MPNCFHCTLQQTQHHAPQDCAYCIEQHQVLIHQHVGVCYTKVTKVECLPTLAGTTAGAGLRSALPALLSRAAPAASGWLEADKKWCQLLAITSGGCTLHGDGHALQHRCPPGSTENSVFGDNSLCCTQEYASLIAGLLPMSLAGIMVHHISSCPNQPKQ